jgi:hypothetical protein
MNAFDTIKVKCPRDLIQYQPNNDNRFMRVDRTDPETGLISTKYSLLPTVTKGYLGLGEVRLDETSATITVSAKALGQDYVTGIRADNIERVFENALPEWITTNTTALVEGADVMRADLTENVPCSDIDRALVEFAQWEHNTKRYSKASHGRGRMTGLVYGSILKSENTRMIIYDKVQELSTRSGREDMTRLGAERFEGTIRVEYNARSFNTIRTVLGLGKGVPRLTEVLESQERGLYKGYCAVLPQHQERVSMDNTGTFTEFRNRIAYEHIFDACEWDWKTIEYTIRARYSKTSNPHRRISEARDYYRTLGAELGQSKTGEVERVRSWLASH